MITTASEASWTFGSSETVRRKTLRCSTSCGGNNKKWKEGEGRRRVTAGLCGNGNGGADKGDLVDALRKGEQKAGVEYAEVDTRPELILLHQELRLLSQLVPKAG